MSWLNVNRETVKIQDKKKFGARSPRKKKGRVRNKVTDRAHVTNSWLIGLVIFFVGGESGYRLESKVPRVLK